MFKITSIVVLVFLLFSMVACERQIDKDLISAAAHDGIEEVEALLNKGANIEAHASDDWTALTIAAERGRFNTVKLLLEKGAKVNAKEGGGHTALFWAKEHKHTEVAELLIKAGAINE